MNTKELESLSYVSSTPPVPEENKDPDIELKTEVKESHIVDQPLTEIEALGWQEIAGRILKTKPACNCILCTQEHEFYIESPNDR